MLDLQISQQAINTRVGLGSLWADNWAGSGLETAGSYRCIDLRIQPTKLPIWRQLFLARLVTGEGYVADRVFPSSSFIHIIEKTISCFETPRHQAVCFVHLLLLSLGKQLQTRQLKLHPVVTSKRKTQGTNVGPLWLVHGPKWHPPHGPHGLKLVLDCLITSGVREKQSLVDRQP